MFPEDTYAHGWWLLTLRKRIGDMLKNEENQHYNGRVYPLFEDNNTWSNICL